MFLKFNLWISLPVPWLEYWVGSIIIFCSIVRSWNYEFRDFEMVVFYDGFSVLNVIPRDLIGLQVNLT